MICPKCKTKVDFLFIYSTEIAEAEVDENGKITKTVNPITGQPDCYVCPECDEDITNSVTK